MIKILVTGGCGFIGSAFIKRVLQGPEYIVWNLDSLTYAADLRNLKDVDERRYVLCVGTVADANLVHVLINKDFKPDFVVHMAAESHVDRSITDSDDFVATNVNGTHNVLRAVTDWGCKLIHVSTDEVYGDISFDTVPLDESARLLPSNPYSATKAAGDMLCGAFRRTYGTNVIVVRPTNNYGPYQHPEKFISKAITQLLQNKRVPLYGTGTNIREWLYVEDNVDALFMLLHDNKHVVYNIGSGANIDNTTMLSHILGSMGKGTEYVENVEDRLGHDLRYAVNSTRIQDLGWEPKVNLNEGLKRTIEWYAKNEYWWMSK